MSLIFNRALTAIKVNCTLARQLLEAPAKTLNPSVRLTAQRLETDQCNPVPVQSIKHEWEGWLRH